MFTNSSLVLNPSYIAPSTWWQHVPLAHWLVSVIQPKVIVELGTHYGVSFFAFCEAAEAFSPESFVFAVDTWEGDDHAGLYTEDVYSRVANHWSRRHRKRSRLIRSTFDDAASHFDYSSIDILHIDGLHTYEAVKHDFETWLPLLKDDSIILFHDINVRERGFGVWRLWHELKANSDYSSTEVLNGHGLGILVKGSRFKQLLVESELIMPLLVAKGEILEMIAELTPGGSFSKTWFEINAEQAVAEVDQAKAEAEQAKAELEQAKAEVEQAKAEVEQAKAEVEQAKAEAKQAKVLLASIMNSKVWKATLPIRQTLNLFKGSTKN